MKLFVTVAEMGAVPRIRRPKLIHRTDQIVAQACRLGWTVGITMDDLVGAQCGAVIGLYPQDDAWLSDEGMVGVWYNTHEDASAHQHAMDVDPHGHFTAMVVSPLLTGRLNPPDICLIYANPEQMILLINVYSGVVIASWNGGASASQLALILGVGLWLRVSRACRSRAMLIGAMLA